MTLPREVHEALDRMCKPLDPSRLRGVTADEDSRCMEIIRTHLMIQDSEIDKWKLINQGKDGIIEIQKLEIRDSKSSLAAADALLADYADRLERGEPWMHKGAKFTTWIKEIVSDMRTHLRTGNTEAK